MTQHVEGRYRLKAIIKGTGPYTATGYVHDGYETKALTFVEVLGQFDNRKAAHEAAISAARAEARKLIEAAGSDA